MKRKGEKTMIKLNRIKSPKLADWYWCDKNGNFYSRRYSDIPHKIKTNTTGNGKYQIARLVKRDGTYGTFLIHRLIAETMCEKPEGKYEVDHINRNSLDNRPCNLRWVTHSENMKNTRWSA